MAVVDVMIKKIIIIIKDYAVVFTCCCVTMLHTIQLTSVHDEME